MSNLTSASARSLSEARSAARSSVAFFDLSDRTQIEVTGSDRARILHSFTSNDIKRLKPGQGCETFLTSLKGKVVAHFFAFCGETSFWLDGTPGQEETITNHLKKYVLIDDVQIHPSGTTRGELFVTGPLAASLLQSEGSFELGQHLQRETDQQSLNIRRVDLLGAPGFLLSLPADQVEGVKRGLAVVGVDEGSRELFELLRIEAGYPQYGGDITEENLAQEVARTKQCISFNKGCYLGQETIARLDAVGHTNRELRRLHFDSPIVPVRGTPIFDHEGLHELGSVTSAAANLGKSTAGNADAVVALGYIKHAACLPDHLISVMVNGQRIQGHVL